MFHFLPRGLRAHSPILLRAQRQKGCSWAGALPGAVPRQELLPQAQHTGLGPSLEHGWMLGQAQGERLHCRKSFKQGLKCLSLCYFSFRKPTTTKPTKALHNWGVDPESFISLWVWYDGFHYWINIFWPVLDLCISLSYKPWTSLALVRREDAQQPASGPHSKNLFYLQNTERKLYTQELGAGQSQCTAWVFEYFLHVFSLESNQGAA